MKKYLREFKEFAVKGSVIDLAVAVIIGAAFGKIVSSFVANIIMPLIGVIIGGVDFASWKIKIASATINIGVFLQNVFDFIIIALVIFLMIKIIGHLKRQLIKEQDAETAVPAPLSKDQELLTEIRDLLKK